MNIRASISVLLLCLALPAGGCASAYIDSLGGDTNQVFSKIYLTDFDTAWEASLDALKHNRLDVSNRDSGYIQTRWTDNTEDKNFTESFGGQDTYLKAQYRFRVNVAKGYYEGQPSVKVTVQKDQLIQRDVLEGWTSVVSDSIEENTLLYRVGRLILIRMKLARLEKEKADKAVESSGM